MSRRIHASTLNSTMTSVRFVDVAAYLVHVVLLKAFASYMRCHAENILTML